MAPGTIAEDFDVLEGIEFGLSSGCISASVDQFEFEGCEEAFHRCIVIAATRAAHARRDGVVLDQALIGMAGKLGTAI